MHHVAHASFDLAASARQTMIEEGFAPDFSAEAMQQLAALGPLPADAGAEDLRGLLWSSIDNDSSRDLDQIEVAERVEGGIRLRIGIADVDAEVKTGTPQRKAAATRLRLFFPLWAARSSSRAARYLPTRK